MSVLIFIIILAILVFVHELGHFAVAKLSGMRVDEFGLGFPPRVFSVKRGETVYSLNAIPFGGFVKIFGENPDQESLEGLDSSRSMTSKSKPKQIAVLIAGIVCNVIFAWLLISAGFMIGQPASIDAYPGVPIENPVITITALEPGSPAEAAGFQPGDVITEIFATDAQLSNYEPAVESVQRLIADHANQEIAVSILRNNQPEIINVTPRASTPGSTPVIGVGLDMVGTVKLPFFKALYEGGVLTVRLLEMIVVGLYQFFGSIFRGAASLSDVSGPVGIAGLVGDARALGFIYLVSFTAYISLNLAIINLIPFPALDGGRILFVLIEAVIRRPIPHKVANTLNAIGFLLLITLMIVVTYSDIVKLIP